MDHTEGGVIESADHARRERESIVINVNRQPVHMKADDATGLEIKEAAIRAGVHIQLDFVLSRKVGASHVIVGDSDRIELEEGEQFSAVAPDDNS